MSITRVKPTGWATNEKLSSSDMSDVDANTSFALDKRSGQTDTLASVVTVSGAMTHTAALSASSTVSLSGAVTFGLLGSASFGGVCTFANSSVTTFGGACTHNG